MSGPKSKEVLIRKVDLIWYPLALVPILALFLAGAYGYLPMLVALFAVFLLFFWLFSFGFAVYSKFRKPPKEPRQ
ncbi:MAG: hypothetical protein Q8L54_06835 [Devosia sp.]|nr:hypothetical protein [Devosia sp.]